MILELDTIEKAKSEEFYARLCIDKKNIEAILGLVDNVANRYFISGQHNSNPFAFCRRRENEAENHYEHGHAFFAVYAIGGNITKQGERPDLDLLVATNAWWDSNDLLFCSPRSTYLVDPIVSALIDRFGEKKVQIHNVLPNPYDLGNTKGKALLTITPKEGKKIDLSYVRSFEGAIGRYCDEKEARKSSFISEEEFIKIDVDADDKPLSRVLLYKNKEAVYFGGQLSNGTPIL